MIDRINNSAPAGQSVTWAVATHMGRVVVTLRTAGANDLPIKLDPQAAFEMGEAMARAAHEARFGVPAQTDASYLRDQIRRRVTEDYRNMMVRKLELMFATFYREQVKWPPAKAAAETFDIVASRLLP